MVAFRIDTRFVAQIVIVAGLASAVVPHWAVGQGLPEECKGLWARLHAAAKAGDLKAAHGREREIAVDPICNSLSVEVKEVMVSLYREEVARLERGDAPPATRLAALGTALKYGNAWDILAKIGDLKRQLPNVSGQPDFAGAAVAYDAAVEAMERAPPSARPTAAEAEKIVALAYQYRALSPTFVPGRALFRNVARQINLERTLVPLQFVFDSDQMTERGRQEAEQMFSVLNEKGMPRIILIGHTDPKGTDDYNDKLSVRRADAVKSFLTARGYPADHITTTGRGKRDINKLKIANRSQFTEEQVHQMLRRVELVWKQ